ncbi:glycosyltransferase [Sulfurimonas sp. HSL-1716]|uniref:glycosyltransferase n=1 Tax=Hydrocurvibacter sulfurireducens TaxID=3131937 RepID=UPI0031F8B191
MKVALFSTTDNSGGAARATYRLKRGLQNMQNIDIDYFVSHKADDLSQAKKLDFKNGDLKEADSAFYSNYIVKNRTALSNTLFSFSYEDTSLPGLDEYDVINLHWIEFFLSLNNLYELTRSNRPIVWTLHDMKPFTGGCHYSSTCKGYESDCSECPQLINDSKSLPKTVLQAKREILKNANITIVAPSQWLADEARKSSLFKDKRIEVIPNSIDSSVFKAIDKAEAKGSLGIDKEKIVLTFGVMNHSEKRKGFFELVEAMKMLKERIKELDVIGLFFGGECSDDFPIPVINLGLVDNDEELSRIYSAADIFILPSLEDNLPNTILESFSCQTAVVAFDTGGAQDIISEENGKIVAKGDIKALSDAVYELIIDKKSREDKAKNGRELIVQQYQLHHQAKAYNKLFEELKEESFYYQDRNIDVNSYFDALLGLTCRSFLPTKKLRFSQNFNKFFEQINSIEEQCIIYGHGTIGKVIYKLIPEKIVAFVDISSNVISCDIAVGAVYSPKNLPNMQYEKVIISVFGREEEIINYLLKESGVQKDRIITLDI